ncbi:capsule biosynthesis protein [Shinella zoogloeoides]|uniref:capsule biosynthesis protein n=1 Tax=Shinella zoogloeoides TaxID=352475 RepID=UPI00273D9A70|nr:capsule biosynthesis protein [Shinella zoogloeoides]WLR92392.1 capsule biosynthesis protein [Shinella zoogloeoides]
MTNTIETKTIETPADAEILYGEIREDNRRGGWMRLYDAGKRHLLRRGESEIEHEPAEDVQTKAGDGPPWMFLSFLLMVIVPFVAALVYFAFIASDQYTAEARFAVRSMAEDGSEEKVDAGIMNMQSATQDAFVVTSFIHSSEILKRLDGKIDYRAIFQHPDADFLARFDEGNSAEAFLKYWVKHVSAYIDGPSGIVTLKVQTFQPDDSVKLAQAILDESEKLVNELTVRAREDMMASFRKEVERTDRLYQEALAKLKQFQQKSGLLSPEEQAKQKGVLMTGLLASKLEIESQLFVARQANKTDSPRYRQLLLTQQSLDDQIDKMGAQLTGDADASLASMITGFSAVETDRLVAEKLYEAARRNYDQAFAAAVRQALYLTVFVRPALPEEALYPKRLLSPVLIFLGFLVTWATLALVWASVEDHRL